MIEEDRNNTLRILR